MRMKNFVDSEDGWMDNKEATGNDRVNSVGSSLCFFRTLPHPHLLSGVEVKRPYINYIIYIFHSDSPYITD